MTNNPSENQGPDKRDPGEELEQVVREILSRKPGEDQPPPVTDELTEASLDAAVNQVPAELWRFSTEISESLKDIAQTIHKEYALLNKISRAAAQKTAQLERLHRLDALSTGLADLEAEYQQRQKELKADLQAQRASQQAETQKLEQEHRGYLDQLEKQLAEQLQVLQAEREKQRVLWEEEKKQHERELQGYLERIRAQRKTEAERLEAEQNAQRKSWGEEKTRHEHDFSLFLQGIAKLRAKEQQKFQEEQASQRALMEKERSRLQKERELFLEELNRQKVIEKQRLESEKAEQHRLWQEEKEGRLGRLEARLKEIEDLRAEEADTWEAKMASQRDQLEAEFRNKLRSLEERNNELQSDLENWRSREASLRQKEEELSKLRTDHERLMEKFLWLTSSSGSSSTEESRPAVQPSLADVPAEAPHEWKYTPEPAERGEGGWASIPETSEAEPHPAAESAGEHQHIGSDRGLLPLPEIMREHTRRLEELRRSLNEARTRLQAECSARERTGRE